MFYLINQLKPFDIVSKTVEGIFPPFCLPLSEIQRNVELDCQPQNAKTELIVNKF